MAPSAQFKNNAITGLRKKAPRAGSAYIERIILVFETIVDCFRLFHKNQ